MPRGSASRNRRRNSIRSTYVNLLSRFFGPVPSNVIKTVLRQVPRLEQPPINKWRQSGLSKKGIAASDLVTGQLSITCGAGKYSRFHVVLAISTLLAAKDTVEDNEQVIIDKYTHCSQFFANEDFLITPVLFQMEEGEVLISTDLTAVDLQDQIEEIVSGKGTYSCKIGETVWSNMHPQLAAAGHEFNSKISLDLSSEASRWMEDFYRRKQREEALLPLFLGFFITFPAVAKTVTQIGRTTSVDHTKTSDISKRL